MKNAVDALYEKKDLGIHTEMITVSMRRLMRAGVENDSKKNLNTGGAMDFAFGAYHSKGGRGIVAFPSTEREGTISRIQTILTPGAAVSISRNIVDYVVTEYGIAKLRGRTIRQRRDALISIAHPDFCERLQKEADALMIW